MTAKEIRTISQDDYLRALALYTLGSENFRKAWDCQIAMEKALGLPVNEGSHPSDAMFSGEAPSSFAFDESLAKADIAVKAKKV